MRSLGKRALRQVKDHPHAIDHLIAYLEAPHDKLYEKGGWPVRNAPYVLALPRGGFATIDAIERSHPFQLWPFIEEANVQARIGPNPLRSHMLGQGEDEDEAVRALVFYTFTNTRGVEQNLHDFAQFVSTQLENVKTMNAGMLVREAEQEQGHVQVTR